MRHVIRARVLVNGSFLWGWEAEDVAGRRLESSWEDHWESFDSPDEALCAGFVRLGARLAPGAGVSARPRVLVIVRRGDAGLLAALADLLRGREDGRVIRDRRASERRRRRPARHSERRRGERRAHPDVDAQILALGWSAVLLADGRAPLTMPELMAPAGSPAAADATLTRARTA